MYMYIAVYLRYHVSLLVNMNIFYMTPQRATWKNSYYMLNVLPSINKVLLLLLLLHVIKSDLKWCIHLSRSLFSYYGSYVILQQDKALEK